MYLEGGLISVIETVTLPAQPTAGNVTYIPLGGDGFQAPQGAYSINGHAVTGDAGGGVAQLRINCDARYCSLISWTNGFIAQGTPADVEFRTTMSSISGAGVPLMTHSGITVALVAAFVVEINELWNVPPVILPGAGDPGTLLWTWVNTLADVYSCSAMIYLFDIRVRELTPMGPLLWARGST